MAIKISVKGKVIFNGKEYDSAAELPDDVRHAYERAIGRSAGAGDPHRPLLAGRIVFNGQEYGNVDEMPANVRRMYDAVMAAVEESVAESSARDRSAAALADAAHIAPVGAAPTPIGPESTPSQTLIAITAVGLLLLVLYVLSSIRTAP